MYLQILVSASDSEDVQTRRSLDIEGLGGRQVGELWGTAVSDDVDHRSRCVKTWRDSAICHSKLYLQVNKIIVLLSYHLMFSPCICTL